MAVNIFYLESSGTPAISPTPNAGWTDTSQFTRFNSSTTKASSTMTTKNISDAISTQADIIIGQWISPVLTAGQVINAAGQAKIAARFSETAAQNNLFLSWAVYVFNGTTLQTTIASKQNDGTEVATSLTNRTDTHAQSGYTTVAGDQLVFEVGLEGDPTASNTHNGAMSYGSDSATDLPFDDTTTAANNPVIQIVSTNALTFVSGETITADKWHPTSNNPLAEQIGVVSYMKSRFRKYKGLLIPSHIF